MRHTNVHRYLYVKVIWVEHWPVTIFFFYRVCSGTSDKEYKYLVYFLFIFVMHSTCKIRNRNRKRKILLWYDNMFKIVIYIDLTLLWNVGPSKIFGKLMKFSNISAKTFCPLHGSVRYQWNVGILEKSWHCLFEFQKKRIYSLCITLTCLVFILN